MGIVATSMVVASMVVAECGTLEPGHGARVVSGRRAVSDGNRRIMRIAEFTAYRVQIPLKKEIKHASHARTATESLIVTCRLADGTSGWGEGLPRSYVTGETIEQAWELLSDIDWTRHFGGEISSLAEALQRVANCPPLPATGDERGCFGNSLRCAIELSVLDAVCRALQIPLSAVTAAVPETFAIRHQSDRVQYSAAFTAMRPWKQAALGALIRLAGFHQAKVKVGVSGHDDPVMLARIRRWCGPRVDLRLDANEAWTCDTLRERVEPLLPFGITSLEQPVPHTEVSGLAAHRGRIGVALMLDESLCSEVDARRAIEQGTCDLFNIRLSKCGGFVASLKLAALAHQAGLGYQLGCQVGETGILSAAGRHFATSVGDIRYLEGSYDRYLVRERLTVEDLTWKPGGHAPALVGPGLGINIDPNALQRVTQQEARFRVD